MNLQGELDRVFSIYIRLKSANHEGFVECYTCGSILHWTEVDAGHFNLRGNDSTRFDENNVKPQCRDCNRSRGGMNESFEEHLREDLGDEEFEDLVRKGRTTVKYSDEEYRALIAKYKVKIKELGAII